MSYVSNEFNRKCTAAGVECQVSGSIYAFHNQGSERVMVDDAYFLPPGNRLTIVRSQEPNVTKWFVTYTPQT